MNILICDDDSIVHRLIQKLLQDHFTEDHTLHFAKSYEEAKKVLLETKIDLAYLDIQLSQNPNDAMGLEVGRFINGIYPDAEVVMVTSFNDYALISFEIHPYAYLLKPINPAQFVEITKGVMAKVDRKKNPVETIARRLNQGRLFLIVNKEMLWIPYEDILYVEKMSKELIIHTARTAHTVRWTLSKIEEMLPSEFIRVHKSFIVNSAKISRIAEIGDRSYEITFHESNKMALMSRYKASELFALLNITE